MTKLQAALNLLDEFARANPDGMFGFCVTHSRYIESGMAVEDYLAKEIEWALRKVEKKPTAA